jgi:hypothetical protein
MTTLLDLLAVLLALATGRDPREVLLDRWRES